MLRTLLFIPHEIAGLPVFGFGWLLILVGVAFAARVVLARRAGSPETANSSDGAPAASLLADAPMWIMVAVVIAFIVPMVELKNVNGDPVGMAIRGYGVMLLLAVSSAVALAWYRAKARGIDRDLILSLAPWVFIGGIAGARIFYVIQYRDNFIAESWFQTVRNMLAFTEGGLVVYGSFIGGFLAALVFVVRHKLPFLRLGDAIVPCMFVGVFLGRIGCLMNGCCYGGRCDEGVYAMHFPPNSPVYIDQMRSGDLMGMSVDPTSGRIESVEPDSIASRAGIRPGQTLERITEMYPERAEIDTDIPVEAVRPGAAVLVDGKVYRWTADELPLRARAVQPAQLISSFGALVLCLLLCTIPFGRLRDGVVMLGGFSGYAILRFIMEMIRVDEKGQFGTSLSISQWVSIIVLTLSIAGLAWIYRQPTSGKPAVSV